MHKSELENQLTPAFRYFTSFALIFMEKKLVVPPKVGGRVGRQSWEVVREGGMLQSNICFSELKVAIFQKYMHDMELKLNGCVGIVISILQTQKTPKKIPMFRTFLAKS